MLSVPGVWGPFMQEVTFPGDPWLLGGRTYCQHSQQSFCALSKSLVSVPLFFCRGSGSVGPQHLPGLGQKGQIQRNEICLLPFGSLQRSTKTKLPDIVSLDRGRTARRRGSDYPLNSVLCPPLPLSVRSNDLGFSRHSAPSQPFLSHPGSWLSAVSLCHKAYP